jgi:peptidoglycan hydrolase-like protein with peptidoglycan-binding domain
MRTIVVALAVLLAGVLLPFPSQAAGSPPVPFPSAPKGLRPPVTVPSTLDPVPLYQPQVACQPGTPEGVSKLRSLVLTTYGIGGSGNTARSCDEGTSEHADGRAWDWMVAVSNSKQKAAAADFLAWLTKDGGRWARRLGIMYVIYNGKIWGAYRAADGWRTSSGHADHVHISFSWNGAHANTSFWRGKVMPTEYGPCARFTGQPAVIRTAPRTTKCWPLVALVKNSSYAITWYGHSSSSVKTAQKALGVTQTGTLDSTTRNAVLAYQKKYDVPQTSVLDKPTWSSLVPSSITSDASAGYAGGDGSAARYGLEHYSGSAVKRYDAGKAVLFLQVALKVSSKARTGYFGDYTLARLKAFQTAHGLEPTGVAGRAEWEAMAAQ